MQTVKIQGALRESEVDALLLRMRACREEAVIAAVHEDLPLAHALEMLIRTIDAAAGVMTGHTGFLRPVRNADFPPVRATALEPPNPQLLLDAMGAARKETTRGNVDFHSPLHSAFNMLQRAIDAVALLLTGRLEFFWAGGSHPVDTSKSDAAAAEARVRELAARAAQSPGMRNLEQD